MAKPLKDQSPIAGYLNNISASIESHQAYRHGFRIVALGSLVFCVGEAIWLAQHQPTPEERAWLAEEAQGPGFRSFDTWPDVTTVTVNATKHFGLIYALEQGWSQFRSGYSPELLALMDQETNVFIFMDVGDEGYLSSVSATSEAFVRSQPAARLSQDPDFCIRPIWVPTFPQNFPTLPSDQQTSLIEQAQIVVSAQIMEHFESRVANPDLNCRDLPLNQINYERFLAELQSGSRLPLILFSLQGY